MNEKETFDPTKLLVRTLFPEHPRMVVDGVHASGGEYVSRPSLFCTVTFMGWSVADAPAPAPGVVVFPSAVLCVSDFG